MVQNFEDFTNLVKFANFADFWLKSWISAKLYNLLEVHNFLGIVEISKFSTIGYNYIILPKSYNYGGKSSYSNKSMILKVG